MLLVNLAPASCKSVLELYASFADEGYNVEWEMASETPQYPVTEWLSKGEYLELCENIEVYILSCAQIFKNNRSLVLRERTRDGAAGLTRNSRLFGEGFYWKRDQNIWYLDQPELLFFDLIRITKDMSSILIDFFLFVLLHTSSCFHDIISRTSRIDVYCNSKYEPDRFVDEASGHKPRHKQIVHIS